MNTWNNCPLCNNSLQSGDAVNEFVYNLECSYRTCRRKYNYRVNVTYDKIYGDSLEEKVKFGKYSLYRSLYFAGDWFVILDGIYTSLRLPSVPVTKLSEDFIKKALIML